MPILSEPIGRVLGNRYRLVAALGSGASAHVFLAEDMVLQRRVAVKVLQPALARDESFLRRFRAEARSVAALNHPHVLRVFDWGEDDDGPYLVLEYLEGGSLHDMLARGRRLSVTQAARVGAQAADGLAYAHTRGLVHRDVKPANLLFDEEGRVRVADFGVARALAGATLTEPGSGMLGTARYASPEQAQGQSLDGRTDVYSLALVLCEAVTGSVPFDRESPLETLRARVGATLPEDESLGRLGPMLQEAADPSVEGRPDAAGFADALAALADELTPGDPLPLVRRAAMDPPPPGDGPPRADDPTAVDLTAVGAGAREDLTLVGGGDDLTGVTPSAASTRAMPTFGAADVADTGEPTANVAVANGAGSPPIARRRLAPRRWPWVVAVLVLIVCILAAGGLYAWKKQVFVPSHRVPELVGKSLAAARRKLVAEHFVVRVQPATKSTRVAAGKVLRQRPRTGTLMKQGSTVRIVPSAGLPTVDVPSLLGQITCGVARQLLTEAHLQTQCPQATTYSQTVPNGDVISWSYQGTSNPTRVPYGATIDVTVSKGRAPVTLPHLAGNSWTQADATLAAEGLQPRETLAYSTTVKANDVVSTTPAVGTQVPYGSSVTVVVSKGPEYALVPTVIGDGVSKATATIQAAGLTLGPVYGPATGEVFTTAPLAGQKVKVGATVTLYTQTPPPTPPATSATSTTPATTSAGTTGATTTSG